MNNTSNHHDRPLNSHRRSFLASLIAGVMGFTRLNATEAPTRRRGGQRQYGRRGPLSGRRHGGPGRREGQGASDPALNADHTLIRTLLTNRHQFRREIKDLPGGVETVTETDNPQLRAILVQHVQSMKKRVEQVRPIHLRDPLFAALFRNAQKIKEMKVTPTAKGVHVIETSDDPFTIKLIEVHARVVSLFIKNGHQEVRRNHAVPN